MTRLGILALRPFEIWHAWRYRKALRKGKFRRPADAACRPAVGFSDEPTWCNTHRRVLHSCSLAADPRYSGSSKVDATFHGGES